MSLFEACDFEHIFVYDLEFIGDVNNLKSCQIWDISIMHANTGEIFNAIIDPDPQTRTFPPPVVEGLFPLTRQFLSENNALPFNVAWNAILKWVGNRVFGMKCCFVSHNNFCSDKPVLENHILRYNLTIPTNYFFFDSLHFFRDNVKNIYDYSLKGLVKLFMNIDHVDAHRAEIDTKRLYSCLKIYTNNRWTLTGPVYPAYISSLRVLKGIGQSVEMYFWHAGFQCVEIMVQHIINIIIQSNKTPDTCIEQFVNDILRPRDVPADNITTVVQSIFSRYVGSNTLNDVFNA